MREKIIRNGKKKTKRNKAKTYQANNFIPNDLIDLDSTTSDQTSFRDIEFVLLLDIIKASNLSLQTSRKTYCGLIA